MLALTMKTDYALIALSHLARSGHEVANAREIARRHRVPLGLLMKILKILAHERIVVSARGSRGGYRLARDPRDLSLHDIIMAVEGPMRFVRCAGPDPADPEPCDLIDVCPVAGPIRRVHDRFEQFLKNVTLAEITADACACHMREHAVAVPLGVGLAEFH